MSEALEKSRRAWLRFGLLVLLSVLSTLLLLSYEGIPSVRLVEGQRAPSEVVAPAELRFKDPVTQKRAEVQALAEVPDVFAHNQEVQEQIAGQLDAAFKIAWSAQEMVGEGAEWSGDAKEKLGQAFVDAAKIAPDDELLDRLIASEFPASVHETTQRLLSRVMWYYIIADPSFLEAERPALVATIVKDEQRLEPLKDPSLVKSVRDVQIKIREVANTFVESPTVSAADIELAIELAVASVRPNFSKDQAATIKGRIEALKAVGMGETVIPKGTMVVAAGDIVTAQQALIGEMLRAQAERGVWWKAFLGSFLITLLVIGGIAHFCMLYVKKFSSKRRDLLALSFLLLLALGSARFVMEVCEAASSGEGMPVQYVWFVVPVAGCCLLVRVLLNSETAIAFAITASILCGIAMEQDVFYTAYFLVTSLVAASFLGLDSDRRAVLKAGLLGGLAGGVFILLVAFANEGLSGTGGAFGGEGLPWQASLFAIVGGLISAFLVLALLPLFEMAGFVTDLQLLELSNLSHPLLSNLLMRAPGSYHHSVMVGTLAEASAKKVGCNPLMCRVAAYFHDIGKAVSPQYFVENQRSGESPHKQLSPEMSARVIIDHVRNGGEIAKRHKLPQPIIDNIYMHHGTGILFFFYRKAQKTDPNVDPDLFRYPGPKPNTRESGIVHLADKVEAACRSIKEPTEERIRQMIQRIISTTLADGQLENCPLTLQDLYVIAETFEEVILAIHHQRIEYPDTADVSSVEVTTPAPDFDPAETIADVITLDLPPLAGEVHAGRDDAYKAPHEHDYESADALPDTPEIGPGRGRKS